MKQLYDKNGYVDIRAILNNFDMPFVFIVGGRGTGKTYTTLKTIIEDDIPFMLMRRTQAQADIISKTEFSPFKSVARDMGVDVSCKSINKYCSGYYFGENEYPSGYSCALSTVSNIRGFDSSEIEMLVYDEFIPEEHERPIKNEGAAFLNAYETINRNRELTGRKPLRVIALANSNNLANPIFLELGIVNDVAKAIRKNRDCHVDSVRGVAVILLSKSPISDAKRDTALYRLAEGDFSRMSLNNDFVSVDYRNVKNRPLVEYNAVVNVGEITIYRHKSKNELYVSTHYSGSAPKYTSSANDIRKLQKSHFWVWGEYLRGNVYFEDILCEILLTKYFG